MDIAELIKQARKDKGITQEQAAEELMVSRQTISNWERGKSLPDIVSVVRMSELYGLSLDQLLKGDQKMIDKIERDERSAAADRKLFRFGWIAVVLGMAVLVLSQCFEGNPAIDFIDGALPWVLLGLAIAFGAAYLQKEKETDGAEG
jgi:transcriptional regulator with XRE-family HTH domain